jgi:TolB protein
MRCGRSFGVSCTLLLVLTTGCASRSSSPRSSARNVPFQPALAGGSPYLTGPSRADRPEFVGEMMPPPMTPVPADMPFIEAAGSFPLLGSAAGLEESAGVDPMDNLLQASFATEGADTDPAVSPAGDMIYFASTAHRPRPDIYVKSVDGRAVTQLTNDPSSDVMPAVSPDGSRIAFASDRGGTWDIFVMNATGGQAVQVTADTTHEMHPTWSPDGRWLAFCRLGEVSGRWEIWVCDAEQAGVQRFLTLGLFPDWHPSANRIVYQRSRDRGDRLFSLWTLDYVRGEATNLTEIASDPEAAFINPKWSPDGEYVAFAAVPSFSHGVFGEAPVAADVLIMRVRGGGMANLTGGRFANLMPTWGAGNSVFFTSNRAGVQNIWGVNAEAAILAAAQPRMETAVTRAAEAQPTALPQASAIPEMATADGATPAPAQMEPDLPPEIANVPIDDQ